MNGALITYHDTNRQEIADISKETAQHFATVYNLDLLAKHSVAPDSHCYFKKVALTLQELEAGRPFVVWADVDIVFNLNLDPTFLDKWKKPLAMLIDQGPSPVTGFFIAKNDEKVKELFKMWMTLGNVDRVVHEQETFLLLYRNFKWVRDLVDRIPMDYIQDPSTNKAGTIGKHFYSRISNVAHIGMESYRRTYFDTVTAP